MQGVSTLRIYNQDKKCFQTFAINKFAHSDSGFRRMLNFNRMALGAILWIEPFFRNKVKTCVTGFGKQNVERA